MASPALPNGRQKMDRRERRTELGSRGSAMRPETGVRCEFWRGLRNSSIARISRLTDSKFREGVSFLAVPTKLRIKITAKRTPRFRRRRSGVARKPGDYLELMHDRDEWRLSPSVSTSASSGRCARKSPRTIRRSIWTNGATRPKPLPVLRADQRPRRAPARPLLPQDLRCRTR